MAENENARERVKPLSTDDMERIGREQAKIVLADAFQRMGIDPDHPEIWHAFFDGVKPKEAVAAIDMAISRKKSREEFISTVRSEGVKNVMTGLKIILVAGLLYIFTLGTKK
jgi:hypothetical protein